MAHVTSSASGQVSIKASSERSGSQDRDARKVPSSSVKFLNPELSEMAAEKLLEDHMDETIHLFLAMPKGLEYFMNFGPPKDFRERLEVHKLDRQHKRMKEEVDQQMEQFGERWILFEKKKEMFLQDMANFDHFLQDNFKKSSRAKGIFITNLVSKMQAQKELILLRMERESNMQIANKLRLEVEAYEPLDDFTKDVCRTSRYPNFEHVMMRHKALTYSFNKTFVRYVNQQKSEELLLALKASTNARYKNTVTILKQELLTKGKELQKVLDETKYLNGQVQEEKERSKVSMQDDYLMVRSVRNITKSLQHYRGFTEKRLMEPIASGNDVDIMGAVGSLILDYKTILKDVKKNMLKRKQTMKSAKGIANVVVATTSWVTKTKVNLANKASDIHEEENVDEDNNDDE